ncbi:MAG: response regulator transcription factor [Oscillospiraceae bacterium]|nr:response regulator transcription factor [Oscillospiraceae bacterium]MBQ7130261.1 response regulator transcription factor [Oscillospiraceae bacterium]
MSNNKYKILVVEDENNIRSFMETILETGGYQVLTAATCQQGNMMFASHMPDLVILDLGLPDGDGLDLIQVIRKNSSVPILVLSARTLEGDKVAALDLGANDYVTKPFGTAELMARVRAALRIRMLAGDSSDTGDGLYRVEDLTIDCARRIVTVRETEVKLTQTEFNILTLLAQHRGKVLTYAAIIRGIWGSMDEGSIKKLQVNMANIRKKLGIKPGDNRYFINELGVGYRMLEE